MAVLLVGYFHGDPQAVKMKKLYPKKRMGWLEAYGRPVVYAAAFVLGVWAWRFAMDLYPFRTGDNKKETGK